MEARLDTPFESWGGFTKTASGSPTIHGRLRYDPIEGITLDLVENPDGFEALKELTQATVQPTETVLGQLVDGTEVTLYDCYTRNTSVHLGIRIGSPTTLYVNRALFGRHVSDLSHLPVKRYSAELSSLANWTCSTPLKMDHVAAADGKGPGFDLCCRVPDSIDVPLPEREFDVRIAHSMETMNESCIATVAWAAASTIIPHDSLPLETVDQIAWQFQNLMSLLIGERLATRTITLLAAGPPGAPNPESELTLVCLQRGQHDRKDLFAPQMLLPYALVKDDFPAMVEKWFARPEQALLATNIFFGSQDLTSPTVDVRFMAAAQAAESYHRSLGTGLYMEKGAYNAAAEELAKHIPTSIQGDHRQSLKNRLKYGNEYSLRKRLIDMFNRVPEETRRRSAGNVEGFVNKVVSTRNYHTHYDQATKTNVFDGRDMYNAAERLRILVTANLLRDLGVSGENLMAVLERRREFSQWLAQPLAL